MCTLSYTPALGPKYVRAIAGQYGADENVAGL